MTASRLTALLFVSATSTTLFAQTCQDPIVLVVDNENPASDEYDSIRDAIAAIPANGFNATASVSIQIKATGSPYKPNTTIKIRLRGSPSLPLRLESHPDNTTRPKILGSYADDNAAILFQGASFWHVRGLEIDGEGPAAPDL